MIAVWTSLAPGTQWSHSPMVMVPAALALRTNGAATSPAATPPATIPRRDSLACMTLVLPGRNTFCARETERLFLETLSRDTPANKWLYALGDFQRAKSSAASDRVESALAGNAVDVARRRRTDGALGEIARRGRTLAPF